MKDNFEIELLTWHKQGAALEENVHKLDDKKWKSVEIIRIDIATDKKEFSAQYWRKPCKPDCVLPFISGRILHQPSAHCDAICQLVKYPSPQTNLFKVRSPLTETE